MALTSHTGIFHQPIESLDAIALEIDAAKDLLSLSLTCKVLYDIVYYRHLRFRVISCRLEDWRSIEVWDLLARDKALARSVRVLQLQPLGVSDPRFLIPFDTKDSRGICQKSTRNAQAQALPVLEYERYADALAHLKSALKNMSRLASFTWKSQHPWSRRGDSFRQDPKNVMAQVWKALNECSDIRVLNIGHDWYKDDVFFEVFQKTHPLPIHI